MSYFALIIFVISTTIHLYASLKKNTRLRNYTKPFLLTSLLAFYLFSTHEPKLVVILALIFSWIGDLFLMIPGVKWFTIGGISFMISHFFFILSYYTDVIFNNLYIGYVVVLAIIFFIIVYNLFIRLKKYLPSALFYPMFLYLLINGTMNCFAFFRAISNPNPSTIITLIGAILFFISDSALFFVRFKKDGILKTHFLVMLTYSIGELLIVLGLI